MLKPWHLMDCFAALNITLPLSGASEWGQSLLALSDEVGRSGQYKHMSTDAFEQTTSPVLLFCFWAGQSSATAEGEEWLTYQVCRHIYCAHRLNVKQFVIRWKKLLRLLFTRSSHLHLFMSAKTQSSRRVKMKHRQVFSQTQTNRTMWKKWLSQMKWVFFTL